MTPVDLAADLARRLDALGIPYVIGGSLASTLVGEPRSTSDIDVAVSLQIADLEGLIAAVANDFYVSSSAATDAIERKRSFNLIDQRSGLKVDLFVLGDSVLDRLQLERRRRVDLPTTPPCTVWVTSTEDVILRKLQWFIAGDRASDRQWRDVLGVLRAQAGRLDDTYLDETGTLIGIDDDLRRARNQAVQ